MSEKLSANVSLLLLHALVSHLDTVSLSSFECRNPAKTLRGRSFGPFDAGCFWEIIKYTFEYFLFVGWLTAATAMSNPFRCWSDEIDWIDRVQRSHERSQYTIGLVVG